MIMLASSLLFISIPLSLALAGWWSQQAPREKTGPTLLRLSVILIAVYIAAVALRPTLSTDMPVAHFISFSNLSAVMLGLVLFMTLILIKFSNNYMAGEARVGFYWRWLLNTLAAVTLVLISNHLVLFWLGWVGISLSLHKLLTFYPDRPRAVLAAHKKFLLARLAELLLLGAFTLLYLQHGTLFIDGLLAHFVQVKSDSALSLTAFDHIAGVLIALAALIKCAQLPVHGWLMQVVEAPTPISALLHAGVINLGGVLLILFAPLFVQVPLAQWLVLVVAGLTTVICALIMATRISVKVRLAWSTSAQMGLMLLQCALGLFELALLHLVAHSAYKAYAFLNAGNAVNEDMQRRLAPSKNPSRLDWLLAGSFATAFVLIAITALGYQGVWSIWVLLIAALTLLIAQRSGISNKTNLLTILGLAALVVISYSLMKTLIAQLILLSSGLSVAALSAADIWVAALFISLFVMSSLLRYQGHKAAMQRISIALYAGLYLDEWLTRLTLKLWPVRLPQRANIKVLEAEQENNLKELYQ
ncbi:NADH-quinone oxidoreductase subunit L [Motilimonas cestriensis]|nr:NADH-quinone oxidoreductase subunit L [Motilimonas cestriensis]